MQLPHSMFLYLLLCLILHLSLPDALAGPRLVAAAFSPLLVPSCADRCLQKFITSLRSDSCSSTDLQCLCGERAASGFTLGEGALSCVASSCPGASASDYRLAYDLCLGVPGAAFETIRTIRASMATPSTILVGTPSTASATSSPTGIITDSSPDPAPSDFSILFSGTFTPATAITAAPTASATAAAAAADAASSRAVLTRPQIAGVSVAGAAVLLGLLGLLAFLYRRQRKRRSRDSGSSFGNDRLVGGPQTPRRTPPVQSSPGRFGVLTTPVAPKAEQLLGVPSSDRYNRGWVPMGQQRGGAGAFLSPMRPDFSSEVSPASVSSYQTTARLLPDKPSLAVPSGSHSRSSSLHPGQEPKLAGPVALRLTEPTPPTSVAYPSGLHVDPQAPPVPTQPGQIISRQPSDPFLGPGSAGDPRAIMYAMEKRRKSFRDLPPLITPANQNTRNAWSPSGSSRPALPEAVFRPAAARAAGHAGGLPAHPAQGLAPRTLGPAVEFAARPPANLSRKPNYADLRTQPSQASLVPHPLFRSEPAAPPSHPQQHAHPGAHGPVLARADAAAAARQDRPATHYTTASETDIEDEPDSAIEPPSSHVPHLLSPVTEVRTPRRPTPQKTPLSQLRYPAIPPSRSSPRSASTPISPETPPMRQVARSPPMWQSAVTPATPPGAGAGAGPFELPARSPPKKGRFPVQPAEANVPSKGSATRRVLCPSGGGAAVPRSDGLPQPRGLTGWRTPPSHQTKGTR